MRFTKTTVDSILADFKKAVDKLRDHEAAMYAEESKERQVEIDANQRAANASREARRANAAALKIEAMISE